MTPERLDAEQEALRFIPEDLGMKRQSDNSDFRRYQTIA